MNERTSHLEDEAGTSHLEEWGLAHLLGCEVCGHAHE